MSSIINDLYEFGEFRMDVQKRSLWRGEHLVPLTPRAFDLLLALVRSEVRSEVPNGGQIKGSGLTKDELLQTVWSGSIVEESNLTQTIFVLRKALGDTPEQRYILTIPGVGYRFAADVTRVGQKEAAAANIDDSSRNPLKNSSPRRWLFSGTAIVLLLVTLGAYFYWLRSQNAKHAPMGRRMLAVLPFENLTGDASQEYFSDGLTEEMISQLGRINPQNLGLIARTSVMHYKGSHAPLDQIGSELGVQYVLEGSVRRDSGKVRISAQLIQVKDQTHLWARQYDRDLSNLLVLQSEIAREIADEIETSLGDDPKPIRTASPPPLSPETYEAYDLYLKGQYFFNKRTPEGFQRAIVFYQQAIAKDPNSALSYAGLADSYALQGPYSALPPDEFMPKARAAVMRALTIDDNLPEAHTALALIVQNYDWDWQTSEKEFRRAIELNPNYATAHHWYAEHLAWRGRFEEALLESERARQLDPLSLIIAADNGAILYYSRQFDAAITRFRAVSEMDPQFGQGILAVPSYTQKGMFPEALQALEASNSKGPYEFASKAYVYGLSGRMAEARLSLKKLEQLNQQQKLDSALFIRAYIGLGDKDRAFFWLEKAYAQHSNTLITLKVDPLYDPLRGDPRFPALLDRVGLAH